MEVAQQKIVVLIVEDEALIRMDVADFLSSSHVTTVEAANADEALRILSSRQDIDVIFTDVNMPGSMDGLQLARRTTLALSLRRGWCGWQGARYRARLCSMRSLTIWRRSPPP
jgi:CheY-like chemotaxis protein